MLYGKTHKGFPQASRRDPQRGVVALLSTYIVSFTLLVLTTAMFVRSTNEMRMAERSVEMHQAFWLAEAGLDKGLYEILWNQPTSLTPGNPCTTDRTVKLSAVQETTYQICLRALPARYEILSDGTHDNTTQRTELVTAEVERQKPQVEFVHTIYTTDGMEIEAGNVQGSLATSATGKKVIKILGSSITGDIYVPNAAELESAEVLGSTWLGDDGVSPGKLKDLDISEMGDLIPIEPPIKLAGKIKKLPMKPIDKVLRRKNTVAPCLEAGTYFTRGVVLENADLCTHGTVELYVYGKIKIQDSSFYGLPEGVILRAPVNYSPADLRIFAYPRKAPHEITLEGIGTTSASIYAPEMEVNIIKGHVMHGAVISKTAFIDRKSLALAPGNGGTVLYDMGLKDNPIEYNPQMARVMMLLWGAEGSGEGSSKGFIEATPSTPGIGDFSVMGGGGCGGLGGGGGGGGCM